MVESKKRRNPASADITVGRFPILHAIIYRAGYVIGLALEVSLGLIVPSLRHRLNRLTHLMRRRRGRELRNILGRRFAVLFGPVLAPSNNVTIRWAHIMGDGIAAASEGLTADLAVVKKQTLAYPSLECPFLASIVIPCFNYGRFLPEAVNSALTQTLRPIEIIVVNDGSTDPETLRVLGEIEQQGQCQVIHQQNAGASVARNRGIEASHGEYICCLDADDMLESTYLETTVAMLEAYTSAGIAYTWVQMFGRENRTWFTQDSDIENMIIDDSVPAAATFRRDDHIFVNGFSPLMRPGYEDWDFWLSLVELGRAGVCANVSFIRYRVHGRNKGLRSHKQRRRLMAILEARHPRLFGDCGYRDALRKYNVVCPARGDVFAKLRAVKSSHPDKPRILVGIPSLEGAGTEIALLEMMRRLQSECDFTILTTADGDNNAEKQYRALTADIFHLPRFLLPEFWLPFVEALISNRQCSALLSVESKFLDESFPCLCRTHPDLPRIDILSRAPDASSIASNSLVTKHLVVTEDIKDALLARGIEVAKIASIHNIDRRDLFFTH